MTKTMMPSDGRSDGVGTGVPSIADRSSPFSMCPDESPLEIYSAIVLGTGLCIPQQWHLLADLTPDVMPSADRRLAWWWCRRSYALGRGNPDAVHVARHLLAAGLADGPSTVAEWIDAAPVSDTALLYAKAKLVAASRGGAR